MSAALQEPQQSRYNLQNHDIGYATAEAASAVCDFEQGDM